MNIQHSSRTDCWYTPPHVIAMARQVLGSIDFDPASDELGNQLVSAGGFYDRIDDGLSKDWPEGCSVWLNPPGGKIGNKSKTALFWARLMSYASAGHLKHALFMAFSAEALQNTQGKGVPSVMSFPFCIPRKRIAFVDGSGVPGASPSHSNAIVYVPGSVDATEQFVHTFSTLGDVKR